LWDEKDRVMGVFVVRVSRDLTSLKERLHQVLPNEEIEVRELEGNVVLSGQATSQEAKDQAVALSEAFAPKKVTDLVQVGGNLQVQLKVRFAEVNRQATQRLNINLSAFSLGGTYLFTFTNNLTNIQVDPPWNIGTYNNDTSNLQWNLTDAVNGVFGFSLPGGGSVNTFLDALKADGLARILAEPNIVAISGQEADFLAGGEFPVPVPQDNSITIEWKPFGVKLKFKPEVLSNGRLRITVEPEVSQLDYTAAAVIEGFSVPGLTVRKAKTQVELEDGQSFAMAGLFQDELNQAVDKIPWLGDIPILGALFRSSEYQTSQTELLIIVTPTALKPGQAAEVRPLQTEGWITPSSDEVYLLGRLARPAPYFKGPAPSLKELEGEFGHDWVY
jgi:pilus assembly protein CpaC